MILQSHVRPDMSITIIHVFLLALLQVCMMLQIAIALLIMVEHWRLWQRWQAIGGIMNIFVHGKALRIPIMLVDWKHPPVRGYGTQLMSHLRTIIGQLVNPTTHKMQKHAWHYLGIVMVDGMIMLVIGMLTPSVKYHPQWAWTLQRFRQLNL